MHLGKVRSVAAKRRRFELLTCKHLRHALLLLQQTSSIIHFQAAALELAGSSTQRSACGRHQLAARRSGHQQDSSTIDGGLRAYALQNVVGLHDGVACARHATLIDALQVVLVSWARSNAERQTHFAMRCGKIVHAGDKRDFVCTCQRPRRQLQWESSALARRRLFVKRGNGLRQAADIANSVIVPA